AESPKAGWGLVPHPETAVDGDDGTGDVAGVVAGEPGDHFLDLLGGPEPAGRDALLVLGLLRLGQLVGHVGLDEPRRDHVRRDVTGPELASDRAGHADERGLRRREVALEIGRAN